MWSCGAAAAAVVAVVVLASPATATVARFVEQTDVQTTYASVFYVESDDSYVVKTENHPWDGDFEKDEAVRIKYTPGYLVAGWDQLHVKSNSAMDDATVAYAAGYGEAQLTAEMIYNYAYNNGYDTFTPNDKLADYLAKNQAFMAASIASNRSDANGYWYHVDLILRQLQGVCDGYNSSDFAKSFPLPCESMLAINLMGDMEDLSDALASSDEWYTEDRFFRATHCSALVKLVGGASSPSDIYISQDTWSSLNSMTRIMKRYDLNFLQAKGADDRIAGSSIVFSSYPGSLYSGDDFYLTSAGMAVIETTIGNSNPELYQYIVPDTVLEWIRNIMANRLASNSQTWYEVYRQFNSGTYNNMNMILDYKQFKPQEALQDELLTIVEQIPGTVTKTDVTGYLRNMTYWGSYNVAFDQNIRELSGANQAEQLYGPWFSYWNTSRALIFAREQKNVSSLEDLKRLMRLNQFKTDPLSVQTATCEYRGWTNCTPAYTAENVIATRGDLNDPNGIYSLSSFGLRNHVATDSKISTFSTYDSNNLNVWAISGPTNGPPPNQPVFNWSTSYYKDTRHRGMPEAFDFDWVNFNWPF
ncbi:uncharacterized protein MONBRDRAFT_37117 [Monosiga brevicollis MX1]|uniref:Phospholipase B-like n=1 Tax=Monosiga brevicollis TaxID=81824 RepID=A9UZP6_MONBE|nr:uncharacterized protein MONBRDRAFT_37117 [Monosiga brevicollis MX1]EDQ89404.1 predicted protein [Monosiga brevicollis MX1]|eukprot:XP_001745980.1 hypothetical protein [Monosiga brevicollis MX1]